MKKFVVLLVVVAMTCISSMAFAATELGVSGSIDIRSRNFNTLSLDENNDTMDQTDTQERVRLNVDAKVGDTKGKISIENDWDTFGRFEQTQANATNSFLQLREAWINFNVPGVPVNVSVGHQLLQLGNGWFFRSMKYGSDAWVLANVTGDNTAAFVDVKFSEGQTWRSDDMDAYVLLDVMKLGDGAMAGINITDVKARATVATPTESTDLQNIGLHYAGKVGPVALKAELDVQMGKVSDTVAGDMKFKGNQIIVQGNMPLDPVTLNFTVARGSGEDNTTTDIEQMQTALDADPHYTFLYEYKIAGPAGLHSGFANTTALNVGATMAATKSLTVGADLWILQSTEDVADVSVGAAPGSTTTDLGNEIDLKANWAMAENLTWNWVLGYFMPGAGMGEDTATGIQGVLSYKF
jgi:hypothetical protein